MGREQVVGTEPRIQQISVQGAAMVLTAGTGAWAATEAAPSGTQFAFNDVAVVSRTEVWAVGQTQSGPLIERWDGTEWSVVACPAPDRNLTAAGLRGISMMAGTGIAVGGGYDPATRVEAPLIRHWDGRTWTAVQPPDLGDPYVLTAVIGVGSDEAWAVGHTLPRWADATRGVVLHWDGAVWTQADSVAPNGSLVAVAMTSPDDVWAAGEDGNRQPFVLHHDGTKWHDAPVAASTARRGLTGIAATSQNDAWAVGPDSLFHWNGAEWSPTEADGLTGASTVVAGSEVWIAGGAGRLARFDGGQWHRLASSTTTVWTGSASEPGGTVWLVGSQRP